MRTIPWPQSEYVAIRALHRDGWRLVQLADAFGRSPAEISAIIDGRDPAPPPPKRNHGKGGRKPGIGHLPPKRRQEIARKAAMTRWQKAKGARS